MLDYATFVLGAARSLLRQGKPDVIVSLTSPPMVALLGVVAAGMLDARSVFWVMDVYPELAFELGVLRRRSLSGRVLAGLARYALGRSDAVVALGETMARRLDTHTNRTLKNWTPASG